MGLFNFEIIIFVIYTFESYLIFKMNIIDPLSLNKYSVTSPQGLQLLKSYILAYKNLNNIKNIQSGGHGGGAAAGTGGGGGGGGAAAAASKKIQQGEAWLNLKTISNFYIPKFNTNIITIGEYHSWVGDDLISGHRKFTEEDIKRYLNRYKTFVDILTETNKVNNNNCCLTFYTELPLPETDIGTVNILKKYKDIHRAIPDINQNPFEGLLGTNQAIGKISEYIFNMRRQNPNIHTNSFDTRSSYLHMGGIIFQMSLYGIVPKLTQKCIDAFLNLNEYIKSKMRGSAAENVTYMSNLLKQADKRVPSGEILKIYEHIQTHITDDFITLIHGSLKKLYETGYVGWRDVRLCMRYFGDKPLQFKEVLLAYLCEIFLRILKEYYKYRSIDALATMVASSLVFAPNFNIESILQFFRTSKFTHKQLWMTDLYAFFKFFTKHKMNEKCGNYQKSIIIYGGARHAENINYLLEFAFKNECEIIHFNRYGKSYRTLCPTVYYGNHYLLDQNERISAKLKLDSHKQIMKDIMTKSFPEYKFTLENLFRDNAEYIILYSYTIAGFFYFSHNNRDKILTFNEMVSTEIHSFGIPIEDIKPTTIYIYSLAISEEFRGHGLCDYMLYHGLSYIFDKYPDYDIYLKVLKGNLPAIKCYNKTFEKVEENTDYHLYKAKSMDISIFKSNPKLKNIERRGEIPISSQVAYNNHISYQSVRSCLVPYTQIYPKLEKDPTLDSKSKLELPTVRWKPGRFKKKPGESHKDYLSRTSTRPDGVETTRDRVKKTLQLLHEKVKERLRQRREQRTQQQIIQQQRTQQQRTQPQRTPTAEN